MGIQDSEKGQEKVMLRREWKETSLPLDIISEILLRLPVKSAVRCRCVSKLWSSITTLPSFISSFAARSSTVCPRILILSRDKHKLLVFSIPQNQNSDNRPVLVDGYAMEYPENSIMLGSDPLRGLIGYSSSGTITIWNPTTRRIVAIPKSKGGWGHTRIFLGFDPIDGTYKVLSLPTFVSPKSESHPLVYTLNGAEKSWRVIQDITEHSPLWGGGKCINGVLYYKAYLRRDSDYTFLASFHVRTEKMSIIKVPWTRHRNLLVTYHGKLASVTSDGDDITMWVLEDAEKHEWSYKHLHLPFTPYDPASETSFELSGVSDAGEFVYVSSRLRNPYHILYFDPERNSIRGVIAQGVVNSLFWHRNGFRDNGKLLNIYVTCTNHIETLLSL